jgi:pimeloyl-ACP methyl ester carboxylesterase
MAAEHMSGSPPQSLARLLERYDPSAIDVPEGKARVRLAVSDVGRWDVVVNGSRKPQLEPANGHRPDARIEADRATWRHIANDVRGGMSAWDRGRLGMRGSLHLGIGFLAATTGSEEEGRLEFGRVKTSFGNIATVSAGEGEPVLCLPGLGGTKASFMTTVSALADTHRVIAIDLPGFGDSVKPIRAPYDAPWFARTVIATLDALEIDRAHLIGNSMGGRVALETALRHPDRVERVVGLAPAVAWLNERRWAPLLKLVRPELGLLQPAPRAVVNRIVRGIVPGAREGWVAAGVDEFLRAYLTPRGRAAFYAAARNIYLDEPHGDKGFWTRLAALEPDALFVWGKQDTLVPIGFERHVQECLPSARHVELDCGHVPQVESPRQTHQAVLKFLRAPALTAA